MPESPIRRLLRSLVPLGYRRRLANWIRGPRGEGFDDVGSPPARSGGGERRAGIDDGVGGGGGAASSAGGGADAPDERPRRRPSPYAIGVHLPRSVCPECMLKKRTELEARTALPSKRPKPSDPRWRAYKGPGPPARPADAPRPSRKPSTDCRFYTPKGDWQSIVGRRIDAVAFALHDGQPPVQLHLVFDDASTFEIYGSHLAGSSYLRRGDLLEVLSYIHPGFEAHVFAPLPPARGSD
jgi:hypothetical protein